MFRSTTNDFILYTNEREHEVELEEENVLVMAWKKILFLVKK